MTGAMGTITRTVTEQAENPPEMTYMAWFECYGTQIGGTARTEWFWRCPVRRCGDWAGIYADAKQAQVAGLSHRRHNH